MKSEPSGVGQMMYKKKRFTENIYSTNFLLNIFINRVGQCFLTNKKISLPSSVICDFVYSLVFAFFSKVFF